MSTLSELKWGISFKVCWKYSSGRLYPRPLFVGLTPQLPSATIFGVQFRHRFIRILRFKLLIYWVCVIDSIPATTFFLSCFSIFSVRPFPFSDEFQPVSGRHSAAAVLAKLCGVFSSSVGLFGVGFGSVLFSVKLSGEGWFSHFIYLFKAWWTQPNTT